MLTENLRKSIKDYPDFPKKGIIFKDISPVLTNPELFNDLINAMSSNEVYKDADAIIAIDARGFIFGSAISYRTKKPLIMARKKNKLPGNVVQKKYGLEYGEDSLCIKTSSIADYKNFVIIDDLLATGGTARCIGDLLKKMNKKILLLSVVIELTELGGKENLDFPVNSVVKLT